LSLPLLSERRDGLAQISKVFAAALIGMGWFILDMTNHD
jgi:hypothetical protein